MTIYHFEEFLSRIKKKLDQKFPQTDKKLRVVSQQVKLSEEVGELAEQILIRSWGQLHKSWWDNKEELADEIADVMITVWSIAKELDIPLEQALNNKIKKIKVKWWE